MKKIIALFALLSLTSAHAAFLELNNTDEFEKLVSSAKVPVVVQFAASWCGPCQDLRRTFHAIAPSYTDDQVIMAYVDADENGDLQHYLQGGYPTVRTFRDGKLAQPSFVGSQSESKVRAFLDALIHTDSRDFEMMEIGAFCTFH